MRVVGHVAVGRAVPTSRDLGYQKNGRGYQAIVKERPLYVSGAERWSNAARRLSQNRDWTSIMTYRILAAAALAVALAAPALADQTTTKSSTSCWRGTCTTETKTTMPDPPSPKNTGYLPNFSGVAPTGGSHSETLHFPAPIAEPKPVDPKCRAVNACIKIYPGREGVPMGEAVSVRSPNR